MRIVRQFKRIPFLYWVFYFIIMIFAISLNCFFYSSRKKSTNSCRCIICDTEQNIIYNNVDELTFITVPRPLLKDKQRQTMKLALASWLGCSKKSHVLLFINRSEFDPTGKIPDEIDKEFGSGRVIYAGGIRSDHSGVPYINEWFIQGIKHSPSKYVTFINSDILLSSGWLNRVKQVFGIMESHDLPAFLIGQRIDFDLKDEQFKMIKFTQKDILSTIDHVVEISSHNDHSPYGIDTFTFKADDPPFDPQMIPPFIMGRYNWDNWIIGYLNRVCETVTFNLDPPIYHINHRRHNFDVNDSKVAVNHHLKRANKNFFGSNYDTKWQVVNGYLKRRNGREEYKLE